MDLEEELEALGRATSGLRNAIYDLRHEKKRPFAKSVESLVGVRGLSMQGRLPAELPDEVGVELLRVLQEALINAGRHSGARNVEVRLRADGGEIPAEVIDDGRGFDPASVRVNVPAGGGTPGP